jgi:tRNA-guanine family transglycosylase
MFCNTYLLFIQLGTEFVRKAGGLYQFIQRELPFITDSGGFQVFSLAYGSITDELKNRDKKNQETLLLKSRKKGSPSALIEMEPELFLLLKRLFKPKKISVLIKFII